MLSKVQDYFPPNTHPLTLVSDPDGLLADESILSALVERGFAIIQESDPILLRCRIEQVKPLHNVLVITANPIEELPYDFWEQGQPVRLALHTFFPNLSYAILRTLTPYQVAVLLQTGHPKEKIGERHTIGFLLENVFGLKSNLLSQPAYFVIWLSKFHQQLAPMSQQIEDYLVEQLRQIPDYQDWPIQQILRDREGYQDFVQGQWTAFLERQTGTSIEEKAAKYVLHFENDQQLQDALPSLLRYDVIIPVSVESRTALPVWTGPGIRVSDEDSRPRHVTELTELLKSKLSEGTKELRWEEWQIIAHQWAELNNLQNDMGLSNQDEMAPSREIITLLDPAFSEWLRLRYSALASRRLPLPHHVHHVPHYLNYLRTQGKNQKVALLIMDGMSLSDWMVVRQSWEARHSNWHFKESMLLAQIPTITMISRYSLISGLRPADFYRPQAGGPNDSKAWRTFWTREGLSEHEAMLIDLKLEKDDPTPEITNPRLQTLCLVERQIDEIMHGSMLGSVGHHENVKLWASQSNAGINSIKLERILQTLFDQRFTVFISSDHGHCEADGIGKPSEGLMVQSRGRRARMYSDQHTAENIKAAYSDTLLWEGDGLLPTDLIVVLPSGRKAFAEYGEITITHGGITIDEIVVPFVEITENG